MKLQTYFFLIFATIYLLPNQSLGQEKIKIGFHLGQTSNDFGIGLNFSAPIYKEHLTLRLTAENNFLEHLENQAATWTPYQSFRLGLAGNRRISETLNVYGEGGLNLLRPGEDLSATSIFTGSYGLMGMEFITDPSGTCLFVEGGSISTRGRAEKIDGQPLLGLGFAMWFGFRIAL